MTEATPPDPAEEPPATPPAARRPPRSNPRPAGARKPPPARKGTSARSGSGRAATSTSRSGSRRGGTGAAAGRALGSVPEPPPPKPDDTPALAPRPVLLPDLKDTPRADAHPDIVIVATVTDIDVAGVDLKDTPRAEPHPDPEPPPVSATNGTEAHAGATSTGTGGTETTEAGTAEAGTAEAGTAEAGTAEAGTTEAGTTGTEESPAVPEPPAGPGVDLKDTPPLPGTALEAVEGDDEGEATVEKVMFAVAVAPAERPSAPPARLGVLSARRLDRRAVGNLRRIGKLEPGFGTWRRVWSLVLLVLIVALIAAAFAAVLDIVVSILSVLANHAISKSAGS